MGSEHDVISESSAVLLRIYGADDDVVGEYQHERRGQITDVAAEVTADLISDSDLVVWLAPGGGMGAVVPDWAAYRPQPSGAAAAVATFTVTAVDTDLIEQWLAEQYSTEKENDDDRPVPDTRSRPILRGRRNDPRHWAVL